MDINFDFIVEVTVNTPPEITQGPEDKDVALFSSVTLSCMTMGNPEPLIQWYKDDKPLDVFGQVYTINSIQPNDRGFYRCRATSIAFSETVDSNNASILIKGTYISIWNVYVQYVYTYVYILYI